MCEPCIFEIDAGLRVPSRNEFYLVGEIISGVVGVGDCIAKCEVAVRLIGRQISALELVSIKESNPKPALGIVAEDKSELEILASTAWQDARIEITKRVT
ncbi:MAG: hypothetical protein AAGC44_02400 [Planctomycetota bacterium]